MKNPKKLWIILSAIAVALAVIVLLVILIARRNKPAADAGAITSTTTTDTSVATDNSTTTTTTTTIKNTTTTAKAEKLTEKQKKALVSSLDAALTVPESDTVNDPAFLTEMEKKNGYEVLSGESHGDIVIASVRVFAPDLFAIAQQIDAQGGGKSEAELLDAIWQAVSSAQLVEKIIEVEFEKSGDSYTPLITAEFFDAYYGGVFQMYDELLAKEE